MSGLTDSVRHHLQVCSGQKQGWTDTQIVMSLVLLNVAGGDCVDDLRILEKDEGFARVLRRVEMHGLRRKERRAQERRWWKERKRAVPSPAVVFRYLSAFDEPLEEAQRTAGHAFIPAPNEHLQALGRVNEDFLRFAQRAGHPLKSRGVTIGWWILGNSLPFPKGITCGKISPQ